jgi:hypothetical protein
MTTALRATSLVVLVVALSGCRPKDDVKYRCTASFGPSVPTQTYVYEKVPNPEAARDACLADAAKNRPATATQVTCNCQSM